MKGFVVFVFVYATACATEKASICDSALTFEEEQDSMREETLWSGSEDKINSNYKVLTNKMDDVLKGIKVINSVVEELRKNHTALQEEISEIKSAPKVAEEQTNGTPLKETSVFEVFVEQKEKGEPIAATVYEDLIEQKDSIAVESKMEEMTFGKSKLTEPSMLDVLVERRETNSLFELDFKEFERRLSVCGAYSNYAARTAFEAGWRVLSDAFPADRSTNLAMSDWQNMYEKLESVFVDGWGYHQYDRSDLWGLQHDGKYYAIPYFSTGYDLSYNTAKEICRIFESKVAEVHSLTLQERLHHYIRTNMPEIPHGMSELWIGSTGGIEHRSLLYPSGARIALEAIRWYPGYPRPRGREMAIVTRKDIRAPTQGLRNGNIDVLHGVICEK